MTQQAVSTLTSGLTKFDPADPEFQRDPYPFYAALRETDPIHRCTTGDWWLTRYDDVLMVLRDARFSAARTPEDMMAPGVPASFRRLGELLMDMMLLKDPPDHTRLRGLVSKAFTPRVVEGLRERIEAIVDGLLGAVVSRGSGRMDVIQDLATPLPVVVIAELLGIPTQDQWRFKQWSDDIVPVLDGTVRTALLPRAAEASGELAEYLLAVVAERRRDPRQDLLSALTAARDEGDRLSEQELVATTVLLLLAGHETTTNLIGNGTLALLQHPDQLERLRREPELASSAVEELVRWDSPVQATSRLPTEDIELRGVRLEQSVELNVLMGSANHDAAHFVAPERLDLGRTDNRHLSFGFGAHFCLGAPLARLEGSIAFSRIARRLPRLELEDPDPPRRPGFVLRGLESLHVSF